MGVSLPLDDLVDELDRRVVNSPVPAPTSKGISLSAIRGKAFLEAKVCKAK